MNAFGVYPKIYKAVIDIISLCFKPSFKHFLLKKNAPFFITESQNKKANDFSQKVSTEKHLL